MTMIRKLPLPLVAALAGLWAAASPIRAAVILDSGHVDLDFNYSSGTWQTGIDHETAGVLAPADAVFYADPTTAYPNGSAISRPAGAQWDFVGVAEGETFYLLPQVQSSPIVWPGFASEETLPGTFAAYAETDPRVSASAARWITIRLLEVAYYGEGDGEFSLWSTGAFGSSTVWMSTAEGGIAAADKFLFLEGGHTHLNWGFSDIGFYEITFEAAAFLNDGFMTPVSSGPVTFNFGVGTTAIPEPTASALALGSAAFLALRLRRRTDK